MLDRDDTSHVPGFELPPVWHWLYFWPATPCSELGSDGHPQKGGFLPPIPLPRRMWAGGRVQWHTPLCLNQPVHRLSTIQKVSHKAGRSGELVFVQVEHQISHTQGLALTETHDIVYRPLHTQASSPSPTPELPAVKWMKNMVPDEVMLFRYSALTFNSHRIHYDRQYATETEGYPGLVVHGPLMVTWLMDLLQQHCQHAVANLSYKALKPLFVCADQRPIRLCGSPSKDGLSAQLWVEDQQGDTAMHASVVFRNV